MKSSLAHILIASLVVVGATHASAASPDAEAAYRDIEKTLGSVPEFFREFPEFAIRPAWEEMKAVQMNPRTALSAKQKELVGLAVSAQIPCEYCVYFHTQTLKSLGATDDEIKHALAEAALTRHWSAIINGADVDEDEFRAEVKRMADAVRSKKASTAAPKLVDKKSAAKDIEKTFGFTPSFLKLLPDDAMASAWNELKMVEQNPQAPLDNKTLSAIALGVSAQVPCHYCVVFDREFAQVNGLDDRAMKEAVAIAGIVRHWSTFLNGSQMDMEQFRGDADKVAAHMRRREEQQGRGR